MRQVEGEYKLIDKPPVDDASKTDGVYPDPLFMYVYN